MRRTVINTSSFILQHAVNDGRTVHIPSVFLSSCVSGSDIVELGDSGSRTRPARGDRAHCDPKTFSGCSQNRQWQGLAHVCGYCWNAPLKCNPAPSCCSCFPTMHSGDRRGCCWRRNSGRRIFYYVKKGCNIWSSLSTCHSGYPCDPRPHQCACILARVGIGTNVESEAF